MRKAGVRGDPGGDAHRPVGAGSDHPVDRHRADQTLDRRLILGREDAAAVGEPEPGRRGIAVDDGEPDAAGTRGLEQPELGGTRA
jgi:hypothetical protein